LCLIQILCVIFTICSRLFVLYNQILMGALSEEAFSKSNTNHELHVSEISPPLGRIATGIINASDVDRSFFLGSEAPLARINGHNYLVQRTQRNSHLMHVARDGVQEVAYTNSALIHGMLDARLESLSFAQGGEYMEDRFYAFHDGKALPGDIPFYDEMYFHGYAGKVNSKEVAIFSNPDHPYNNEDPDGQLKLWTEMPINNMYGFNIAAPGPKTKKARITTLLRQLKVLRDQKSSGT
jgi:hypothetical protein